MNSLTYTNFLLIPFVIFFLVIYYILNKKYRWFVLLVMSVLFYLSYGIKFLPFILITTIITYVCALFISKSNGNKIRNKVLLYIALFVPLFLLCIKYIVKLDIINYYLDNKYDWWDVDRYIAPIGISFWTLMALSYVIDVYFKKYDAEKNFLKYFTFVIYFPHIVQGPIERYNKKKEELFNPPNFDIDKFLNGFYVIIWGIFLKLVVADRLGIFVKNVMQDYNQNSGFWIWFITILFFSIQSYADFYACMEIGKGISELFMIPMPSNFNLPYFAETLSDYWRRWHITMGEWYKDYVFLPIMMSKFCKKNSKKIRDKFGTKASIKFLNIVPLLVVWPLTGFWHGVGLNYIVWGAAHGSLIIISILFNDSFNNITNLLKMNKQNFSYKLFRILRTFIICSIIRVMLMVDSLDVFVDIISSMFSGWNSYILFDKTLYKFAGSQLEWRISIIAIFVFILVEIFKYNIKKPREWLQNQGLLFRIFIIGFFMAVTIIYGIYGPGTDILNFIYGKF